MRQSICAAAFAAACFAGTASADTYSVLVDNDLNTATGCSITLPESASIIEGIEARITGTISAGAPPTVSAVVLETCQGGVFVGTGSLPAGHPVGLNNGIGGADVIELQAPESSLIPADSDGPVSVRLYGVAQQGSNDDVIAATDPLIIDVIAIPLLGGGGLLILAALVFGAVGLCRRRRPGLLAVSLMLAGTGLVMAANFATDGQVDDWAGEPQAGSDGTGDSALPSTDLVAFFAAEDASSVFFRLDAVDVEVRAPSANDDDYDALNNDLLVVASADGVIDNPDAGEGDDAGQPAAVVDAYGPVGGPLATAPGAAFALPSGNTVTFDADGLGGFSYDATVNPTFTGSESFDYQITNSVGSDTATVTITVNQLPVANDDTYDVDPDAVTTVLTAEGVIQNPNAGETDEPGAPPAVVDAYGPVGGPLATVPGAAFALPSGNTVTFNADGAGGFAYDATVNSGFTGDESFEYQISNAAGSDTAVVTLTVGAEPDAVDDDPGAAYTVDPGSILTIAAGPSDLLANDDLGAPEAAIVTFGATGTESAANNTGTSAQGAVLTVNDDGSFSYEAPDGGVSGGVDQFVYTLENSLGSDTATVTINVNEPPTAVSDSAAVSEDAPATAIDVLANDTNPDSVTTTIVSSTDPANGTVVITGGGTGVTYQPDANYCNNPPGTTPDTFDYTLSPGGSSATVSVTVNCVNDPPTAEDDSFSTDEDTVLNEDVTADNGNGVDTDTEGALLTVSQVNGSGFTAGTPFALPSGATLTMNANGTFAYDPTTSTTFNALDTGEQDSDSFTYTICDPGPLCDSATVSVIIDGVNDAPTVTGAPADYAVHAHLSIAQADGAGDLLATGGGFTITDPEGDPIDIDGTVPTATVQGGTVSINTTTGAFTYHPPSGFTDADDTFQYTVCDDENLCSSPITATLEVSGPRVWFVDNSAAAGGGGTQNAPFDTLSEADTAADDNSDLIYVEHTGTAYSGGISLQPGQRLIGEGLTGSNFDDAFGITPPAGTLTRPALAGTRPVIPGQVTLLSGANHHVRGLNIVTSGANALTGSNVTGIVVDQFLANANGGAAIALTGASNGTVTADSLTSNGSGQAFGVNLDGYTGTLTVTGNTVLSGASNAQLRINNSSTGGNAIAFNGGANNFQATTQAPDAIVIANSPNVTIASGSAYANNGRILQVSGSGVDITLSSVAKTGSGDGVILTNNTGTFTLSGVNVNMNLATGNPFVANNSGTLTITGSTNILNTISGVGINLTDTTIGAAGVQFQRISAANGTNGIILDGIGNGGAFLVSGDGTNARNASGGTLQNTTDDGVFLNDAFNVTLRQMDVLNVGDTANPGDIANTTNDHAVESRGGGNIVLSAVFIQNPLGSGWEAFDITGTNRIDTNSRVEGLDAVSNFAGLRLTNTNTNFALFAIENSTFDHADPTPGDAANNGNSMVVFSARGTTTGAVTVDGSTFVGARGTAMVVNAGDTAGSNGTITSSITNSQFHTAHPINGQTNFAVRSLQGTTHNATISSNTLRDIGRGGSLSGQIIADKSGTGVLDALVNLNTVFDIDDQHGIDALSLSTSTAGRVDWEAVSNRIYDVGRRGIFNSARGSEPDMDVAWRNNILGIDAGSTEQPVGDGTVARRGGEIDVQTAANLQGELTGNTIVAVPTNAGSATSGLAESVMFINVEEFPSGTALAQITMTNNTWTNRGTATHNFISRTRDTGLTEAVDLSGNTADGNTSLAEIVEFAGSTVTVEDLATVAADNPGITTLTVGAGVTDNGGNVPLPDF